MSCVHIFIHSQSLINGWLYAWLHQGIMQVNFHKDGDLVLCTNYFQMIIFLAIHKYIALTYKKYSKGSKSLICCLELIISRRCSFSSGDWNST